MPHPHKTYFTSHQTNPTITSDDCPICGKNFGEVKNVKKLNMSKHLHLKLHMKNDPEKMLELAKERGYKKKE